MSTIENASAQGSSQVLPSRYGFEATLDRLKQAIAGETLWMIHEIDTQRLLAKEGHVIPPFRQLLFFHPRSMIRLITGDPGAQVDAPLRILVREDAQGEVWVQHPALSPALGPGGALGPLGQELQGIYDRVSEAGCR